MIIYQWIFLFVYVTLFNILKINPTTSLREGTIAYRKLARTFHPDKFNFDRNFTEWEGSETLQHIYNAYKDIN